MAHLEDVLVEGQVVRVEKLDNSAQDVDDAVNKSRQLTAPNLLDNWYLSGPINQYGYTTNSGTASSYTIDRWKKDGNCVATLTADGIEFSPLTADKGFYQPFDIQDTVLNKTVTLSVLLKSQDGARVRVGFGGGGGYSPLEQIGTQLQLLTYTGTFTVGSGFVIRVQDVGTHAVFFAAKLELGSVSTLAHREGDTWVLNDPPPDKALELAKCQRYYVRYVNPISYDSIVTANGVPAYSDTRYCNFRLYLPQPLAKTAVSIEHNGLRVVNSTTGAVQTIEAISIPYASQNFINVNVRCTERSAVGTQLQLEIAKGGWLGISAEP